MTLDFTVVFGTRQRFGTGNLGQELGLEESAPFVGLQKSYTFRCPNVVRSEQAILLFQSQGVRSNQSLTINDQIVHGGVPSGGESSVTVAISDPPGDVFGASPINYSLSQWKGNIMIISGGVLKLENELTITSNGDNFIIDNVIAVFKTRSNLVDVEL